MPSVPAESQPACRLRSRTHASADARAANPGLKRCFAFDPRGTGDARAHTADGPAAQRARLRSAAQGNPARYRSASPAAGLACCRDQNRSSSHAGESVVAGRASGHPGHYALERRASGFGELGGADQASGAGRSALPDIGAAAASGGESPGAVRLRARCGRAGLCCGKQPCRRFGHCRRCCRDPCGHPWSSRRNRASETHDAGVGAVQAVAGRVKDFLRPFVARWGKEGSTSFLKKRSKKLLHF